MGTVKMNCCFTLREGFQYDGTFGPWGSKEGIPAVADLNADGRADLVMIDKFTGATYNLNTALSVLNR